MGSPDADMRTYAAAQACLQKLFFVASSKKQDAYTTDDAPAPTAQE